MNFFPFRKHIFPFTYYCFWKHVRGGWGCVFNWLARLICDNHGSTLNDNLIYYRGDSIITGNRVFGYWRMHRTVVEESRDDVCVFTV